MSSRAQPFDPIAAIAVLGEPTRRRLYEYVAAGGLSVGRDEAASALGIGRPLAAFHLDRLVAIGLLAVEYRRLSGRTGPGAGRPAKLYRRGPATVGVSLPPRRYETAAALFATALEAAAPAGPSASLLESARAMGRDLVRDHSPGASVKAAETSAERRARLLAVLAEAGFEPESARAGGPIRLRNCPFDALARSHRALTCAMNLALLEGVASGLGDAGLVPGPADAAGFCCVEFRP